LVIEWSLSSAWVLHGNPEGVFSLIRTWGSLSVAKKITGKGSGKKKKKEGGKRR